MNGYNMSMVKGIIKSMETRPKQKEERVIMNNEIKFNKFYNGFVIGMLTGLFLIYFLGFTELFVIISFFFLNFNIAFLLSYWNG